MDVRRVRGLSAPAAICLLLLTTGCRADEDAAAESTARELVSAVADQDGESACARLVGAARAELEQSSGRSCAEAILEESLAVEGDPQEIEVFGRSAQVRFEQGVVFLALLDEGWRVSAAGCSPVPDQPYDCTIQAG